MLSLSIIGQETYFNLRNTIMSKTTK